MKSIFSFIFLFVSLFSYAQEDIFVQMKTKTFVKGEFPAFVVLIPEADYEKVKKEWSKYLKYDSRGKTVEEKGEINIYFKYYKKISADSLNVFSYVKEYDNEILLVAAFQLNDVFIDRSMDEEIYLPAKKFIRDFAVQSYKNAVKDELSKEEKELKKLENRHSSLLYNKENIIAAISEAEREIITSKDEITLNQMDLSNKVVQMQAQKELVLKLANAGKDDVDDAEKNLKQIEREFNKLKKQTEKLHKNIGDQERIIRTQNLELAKIDGEIKRNNLEIEDQKYRVAKLEKKYERID